MPFVVFEITAHHLSRYFFKLIGHVTDSLHLLLSTIVNDYFIQLLSLFYHSQSFFLFPYDCFHVINFSLFFATIRLSQKTDSASYRSFNDDDCSSLSF